MKSLIKITDNNKETFFNLQIYDILDKIEKRCEKWVKGVFIKVYVSEEIETNNLCNDLDYLFSEAIWLIELAESFNYKMESKQFLEHKYKDYTSIKEGYKKLMTLNYNIKQHRLYTEEEMKVNRDKSNKIAMDILKNISF